MEDGELPIKYQESKNGCMSKQNDEWINTNKMSVFEFFIKNNSFWHLIKVEPTRQKTVIAPDSKLALQKSSMFSEYA